MKLTKGLLISFEGVEGSGKTTQIKLLENFLVELGYDVVLTKEPGGTPVGMTLRQILLDKNITLASKYTEILFFTADRLEHIEQKILPAIEQGKIVITDRFIDSTTAYQLGGRKVEPKVVDFFSELVKLKPDLTLLLDLDPKTGLDRVKNRITGKGEKGFNENRFEQEIINFHQNVRQTYLNIAKKEPKRVKVITVSNRSIELIFKEVALLVENLIKEKNNAKFN